MNKRAFFAVSLVIFLFILTMTTLKFMSEGGKTYVANMLRPNSSNDMQATYRWMWHDGIFRSYSVFTPSGFKLNRKYPLVIFLHGGLGNARQGEEMSGLNAIAEKEKFIVAYPDGESAVRGFKSYKGWNAGFCCGYPMENNVDDTGYVSELIKKMIRDYRVDPKRIYISGVSNGGFLAYRVAAEHPEQIAAIAPVAASIGGKPSKTGPEMIIPKPTEAVSVLAIHGKKDTNVPYDGGVGPRSLSRAEHVSVRESIDFWVQADACKEKSTKIVSKEVSLEENTFCASGAEVVLYTLNNVAHVWPETINGKNTSQLIWDFFKNHSK